MRKLFVALAGNIGTGKTTAAKLISTAFGFELFDERRIRERGRVEEAAISGQFLAGLGAYYQTFPQVAEGKYQLDLLRVDVSRIDIRAAQGKQEFLDLVGGFLQR